MLDLSIIKCYITDMKGNLQGGDEVCLMYLLLCR
mgnify:CR=1 FL=1